MSKKQPPNEPSPRESLGLDAMSDGDLKGLATFLSFSQRELSSFAYITDAPREVRDRVAALASEMAHTLEFTRGFASAIEYARGVAIQRAAEAAQADRRAKARRK